jgi:hypothetical protein
MSRIRNAMRQRFAEGKLDGEGLQVRRLGPTPPRV